MINYFKKKNTYFFYGVILTLCMLSVDKSFSNKIATLNFFIYLYNFDFSFFRCVINLKIQEKYFFIYFFGRFQFAK